jgi:hypothetical protein
MSAAQQTQAGSRWRVVFAALRDVGMTGLALWGVWHQEHTGHVNPWLLGTYVVILGLIPANHAVALARSALPYQQGEPSSAPDTAPMPR